MRLILVGPPGSGKGTQAKLLCQRLGLAHIATGDILRDAVEKDSELGRKAKAYMAAGQLVPDELANDIVRARFRGADRPDTFVMDGYPRTLQQAQAFDAVLREEALPLRAVILLKVEDDEIVRRNSTRWTCLNPECQATYNLTTKPPKTPGRCDVCQQLLHQRDDDKPETIRKRLEIFHRTHDELLRHYEKQGILMKVGGEGDIEAIHGNILKALEIEPLAA